MGSSDKFYSSHNGTYISTSNKRRRIAVAKKKQPENANESCMGKNNIFWLYRTTKTDGEVERKTALFL